MYQTRRIELIYIFVSKKAIGIMPIAFAMIFYIGMPILWHSSNNSLMNEIGGLRFRIVSTVF